MTESLFEFPALKVLGELAAQDAVSQKDFDAICDVFPELVDIAELAQMVTETPFGQINPRKFYALREALKGFANERDKS